MYHARNGRFLLRSVFSHALKPIAGPSFSVSTPQQAVRHLSSFCILESTNDGDSRSNYSLLVGASAAALAAGGTLLNCEGADTASKDEEVEGWHLLPVRQRRNVFYKYEKRIRELSPPEKVFQYFSSEKRPDGSTYMKPQDLLASLVAVYPAEASAVERSGSLPGEPSAPQVASANKQSQFFLAFDLDGDQLISFHEWLLIMTMLSVPSENVQTAFGMLDADDSGSIDSSEFQALVDILKASNPSSSPRAGRTGFHGGPTENESGLYKHFFGAAMDRKLSSADFGKFLEDMNRELDKLEFQHYDPNNTGSISGRDFAHSLISCVGVRHLDQYFSKVVHQIEELPAVLLEARISYKAFSVLAKLRRDSQQMVWAMSLLHQTTGHFRRADLQRAAKVISGTQLDSAQVDIIFSLFMMEADSDSLNPQKFASAIIHRDCQGLKWRGDEQDSDKDSLLVSMLKWCGWSS